LSAEHLHALEPEVKLDLGANDDEQSIGSLFVRLERVLLDRAPELVIVFGDSMAALTAALVTSRLHLALAHVEAGRRTFCKHAPEEVNRLVIDRVADLLLCSTSSDARHLAHEGRLTGVHVTGDVLLDALNQYLPIIQQHSTIFERIGLHPGLYLLAMLSRADTINTPAHWRAIISAFNAIREPIVVTSTLPAQLPLERLGLTLAPHILPIDLASYADRLMLESHARTIITDSADVQREAYLLSIPCITLGDLTDISEAVTAGWNRIIPAQLDHIIAAVRDFLPSIEHPPLFGDGHAAERIVAILNENPITFGQNYDRIPIMVAPSPAVVETN
jgi:UDP-N-acetylglucosamine 2-epimerase